MSVDSVIDMILQLKVTVIVSGIGILLCGLFLFLATNKFRWDNQRTKITGFFFDLGWREAVTLGICFLRVFFVISIMVTGCAVSTIHIVYCTALLIAYFIIRKGANRIAYDFISGVTSTATLVIMQMLRSYVQEVFWDTRIVFALILLSVILFIYSLCDLFNYTILVMEMADKKRRDSYAGIANNQK